MAKGRSSSGSRSSAKVLPSLRGLSDADRSSALETEFPLDSIIRVNPRLSEAAPAVRKWLEATAVADRGIESIARGVAQNSAPGNSKQGLRAWEKDFKDALKTATTEGEKNYARRALQAGKRARQIQRAVFGRST